VVRVTGEQLTGKVTTSVRAQGCWTGTRSEWVNCSLSGNVNMRAHELRADQYGLAGEASKQACAHAGRADRRGEVMKQSCFVSWI
jgi:hypothetical protein